MLFHYQVAKLIGGTSNKDLSTNVDSPESDKFVDNTKQESSEDLTLTLSKPVDEIIRDTVQDELNQLTLKKIKPTREKNKSRNETDDNLKNKDSEFSNDCGSVLNKDDLEITVQNINGVETLKETNGRPSYTTEQNFVDENHGTTSQIHIEKLISSEENKVNREFETKVIKLIEIAK